MTRFVVVMGADTDVGKTFVTEALARLLSRDRRVVAIKPFESGASEGAGDGERLAAATGQVAPTHALVRLRAPLAPAVAADREGVIVDFAKLVGEIRSLASEADIALVEGAGGLLSPLTWTHDALHLAHDLDATVVLVASDRLGTLSATHAAVQVLLDTRLLPTAIVLSGPKVPDASTGTNAAALRRRLQPYAHVAERIVELPRTDGTIAIDLLVPVAAWLDGAPLSSV